MTLGAVLAALALLGGGAWYLLAAPCSQLLCPAISAVRGRRNVVALTFDDGPGAETPLILDILKEHGIKATFFLCGANVEKFPAAARQIVEQGHAVGNHAYSHRSFLGKSPDWMRRDIERAAEVIKKHQADSPSPRGAAGALFRPPYGIRWFGLAGVLKTLGLSAVMWDVNSEDWKRRPEDISAKVLREARPGSIILLHDGMPPQETGSRAHTVAALPAIIERLTQSSLKFVTVPQLMEPFDETTATS